MAELGLTNILNEDEINLFMDDDNDSTEETVEVSTEEDDSSDGEKKEKNTGSATEVDPDTLFEEEQKDEPESVGSGEQDNEGKEKDSTSEGSDGTSPDNFYSSIATAMAEDGIFPNLDDETLSSIVDAESFSDAVEREITARLDEKQQRISKALDNGVPPSSIQMYENTLHKLSTIKDSDLSAETSQGENLRYQLITQAYLNKGFSSEKADKMARRSIDAGQDIEDAKEALEDNKDFFQSKYRELLVDAEKAAERDKEKRKKESDELKTSLMKDKTLLGDMEISQELRRKTFDSISKPVYKDPSTGEYMTAIQRYEREHRSDFVKYVGLIFTLTNGFKDFDGFTKGKVKKEVSKGLKELERKLNTTQRNSSGALKMVNSRKEDPESFLSKGFKLDI